MDAENIQIPLSQGKFTLIDKADYDLVSNRKWHASKAGNYWRALAKGKRVSGEKRKSYLLYRLIVGAKDGQMVDHINGDTLDNRRANLRICTVKENQRNQHARRGSSKYKGVYWHKKYKKWTAKIIINSGALFLGNFFNEEDAGRAYDNAATEHFSKFANLNFKTN